MAEIVEGASVNNATPKVVNTHSNFDLSYPLAGTYRFGEYAPNFVMECVPNDRNVRLQSIHDVRSTSLGAPLLADIMLKKDYFRVNMEAILPMNWDKIYTNPTIGEDVDASLCGANIKNVLTTLKSLNDYLIGLNGDISGNSEYVLSCFAYFISLEKFFSKGSLLASLGINLSNFYKAYYNEKPLSFDECFQLFCEDFVSHYYGTTDSPYLDYFVAKDTFGNIYRVFHTVTESVQDITPTVTDQIIDFKHFLSIFRDDGIVSITLLDSVDVQFWDDFISTINIPVPSQDFDLNISRVWAYQLAVSHFFSNDHIDYVYSAELYRQLIRNFTSNVELEFDTVMPDFFTLNGLTYHYDFLSAWYIREMFKFIQGQAVDIQSHAVTVSFAQYLKLFLPWLNAIFSFRNSLRYKDYFTGAKSRPLAVGDLDVSVNNNAVSIIDTTRTTMMQRFLNACNRFGRKSKEYLEGLFPGLRVTEDMHNPLWLGHTTDVIYSNEVENTADAQQSKPVSVTSTLRSNASKYAFEIDIDRPCILIGILYFDIQRYYGDTIERQNLHIDRFDMFNPFMQYIGDQEVYQLEQGLNNIQVVPPFTPFAYQLRHSEYKQRIPQYFGGFSNSLRGWLFEYQPSNVPFISPSYIRSYPSELDRFYISLGGYSLESYFHFIIKNVNNVSANRPMVYAPSIL